MISFIFPSTLHIHTHNAHFAGEETEVPREFQWLVLSTPVRWIGKRDFRPLLPASKDHVQYPDELPRNNRQLSLFHFFCFGAIGALQEVKVNA